MMYSDAQRLPGASYRAGWTSHPIAVIKLHAGHGYASYLFPGPGGESARMAIKRLLPDAVRGWSHVKAVQAEGREEVGHLRDAEGRRIAEPEGVTFHTFRHAMASNALNVGIAEHIVNGWELEGPPDTGALRPPGGRELARRRVEARVDPPGPFVT